MKEEFNENYISSIYYRNAFINNNVFLIEERGMKTVSLLELPSAIKLGNDIDNHLFLDLSSMLTKKGKSNKFSKYLLDGLIFLRRYFYVDPLLLIRSIIVKSESVFILDKYKFGRREKIMPRFGGLRRSERYVLREMCRNIMRYNNGYDKVYLSVVYTVLDYFLVENKMVVENKENNEVARINKYSLLNRKRRKRKLKLYRQVDGWR